MNIGLNFSVQRTGTQRPKGVVHFADATTGRPACGGRLGDRERALQTLLVDEVDCLRCLQMRIRALEKTKTGQGVIGQPDLLTIKDDKVVSVDFHAPERKGDDQ